MTHPNDDFPVLTEIVDELPVLTDIVVSQAHDELPVLTEIAGNELSAAVRGLSPDEMMLLLQKLETHLETVFTDKLNNQLGQLQRLAVNLAVSEFKAELPKLLHDALLELKKPY